ncbi:hypothetical protein ACLB2K_034954 [Fragaria x ananassa]
MGTLSSIETLKLDDNMFMGELPSSLKNCTNLRAFDLENNELSGPILERLGVGASKLAILILRSNHFNGSMPSQLCHLTSIQVLDLSMNNISGSIPKCLNNWTSLAKKGNPALTIRHSYISQNGSGSILGLWYDDEISIIWKRRLSNYKSTLGLLKSIDFSSNRLTGEIPVEITHLLGLISLNVAGNYLTGTISPEIGKLQSLQSLDLSRNQISGSIPPSLLKIYVLGYLNLSYNNLFGKIPIGTQLQNYGASSFLGNPKLCGIPLEICNLEGTGQPNVSSDQEDSDNKQITRGFYISLGLGFVVGFWGLCGSLIFKRSWRYKYYNFLNASHDWLYGKIPPQVHGALIVEKGKIRTMQNKRMAAYPVPTPGANLLGDEFNIRHPLTGGGMIVARLSQTLFFSTVFLDLYVISMKHLLCAITLNHSIHCASQFHDCHLPKPHWLGLCTRCFVHHQIRLDRKYVKHVLAI